jgi:hypothetical protein
MSVVLARKRGKQENSDWEASLCYIVSFRSAGATWQEPLSKKQKQNTRENKKNPELPIC